MLGHGWTFLIVIGIAALVDAQRCSSSEAYFISDGRDYRGSVNITATGIPCLAWSMQSDIQVPNPSLGLLVNDNSCRNPFGQAAPFCFTSNPVAPYQLCNVGPACPFVSPSPSISFQPSATSVAAGTFVSIVCFPQPCQVYFTLDGSTPKIGVSPFYEHSIALTASATISAAGLLLSGTVLYARQYFTVFLPPPIPTTFFPDPSVGYFAPVLVSLRALQPGTSVIVFQNSQALGSLYSGPFWLATSTTLVAVLNQTQTIVAAYTIVCPSPAPPNVFPGGGGSFIGGVTVLVYQPSAAVLIEASVNSSSWVPMLASSFAITSIGLTTFSVRATYLGGLVSGNATSNYTVFPALPPTCFPNGNAVYSLVTNVTCVNPVGRLLQLTVNGLLVPQSFWVLNLPGNYTIAASYTDDGGYVRTTKLYYLIAPQRLSAPLISPCTGTFLGPLVVSIQLGQILASSWNLQTNLNGSGLVYLLSASGTVTAKLSSFDPMFLDSMPTTCSLAVFSDTSGTSATTPVRVLNPPPALMTTLGNCLLLGLPQLFVSISAPIGPYVLVNMANLTSLLVGIYDARLSQCLATTPGARQSYALATSYSPVESSVVVGNIVHLQISGSLLRNISYVVVRSEYGCDDVGLPVTGCSSAMFCGVLPAFVGSYTLCANCGDGLYRVPSLGSIIVTSAPATVASPLVTPCGGALSGPTMVTIDLSMSPVLYSLNSSSWNVAPPTLLITPPSNLVVRGGAGLQTVCLYYSASPTATSFTGYFVNFVGQNGIRLALQGNAAINTDVTIQIQQSPNCADQWPLFKSYLTFNGTGWYTDSIFSLAMPVADGSALSVCVGGASLPWTGSLPVSRLAMSTVACSLSPTGCYNAIPTCIGSSGVLSLCASPTQVSLPPTSGGVSLKLVLVLLYAGVVAVIIFMWQTAEHEDIPGPAPAHHHRHEHRQHHSGYYHEEASSK